MTSRISSGAVKHLDSRAVRPQVPLPWVFRKADNNAQAVIKRIMVPMADSVVLSKRHQEKLHKAMNLKSSQGAGKAKAKSKAKGKAAKAQGKKRKSAGAEPVEAEAEPAEAEPAAPAAAAAAAEPEPVATAVTTVTTEDGEARDKVQQRT